jgi:ATP-dependent Clp protease ATP-binding subunit ClpC
MPPLHMPGRPGDDDPTLHDLLMQCASNLTEKAAHGELTAVYGRDQEIDQILTSLASPLKGRIVVTGGARVGKTAVIQAVAARIYEGHCPEVLKGSQLWALSARSILRAFGVRDWHDKLGRLMEKWADRPDVILNVDALPTTLMAGATAEDPYDMAQFLLGQLQSSSNRILAEGRSSAVQAFLETYTEYKHVLMEVRVPELSLDASADIVTKATHDLEQSQNVNVSAQAVDAAIDLTRRFALNERLPGKAIDLIAEGIALQSERDVESPEVTKKDIVDRFGERTGLPHILLSDEEPYDEAIVRRYFSDRVLGQDQAVDVVVQTLSLLRTRLNNPDRPMGVFLFMGPTGVGKTELARALSGFLFSSEDHIVRFNMADYTAEWHTDTLFGSPHGFGLDARRGQLTVRLQDHAFAVILLDEFEKAHPEVFQRFLQLFDEGMLLNGASETVNLRNSIFILTSNFGARLLQSGKLGFGPSISQDDQENRIREEMVHFFTPEFINRIDAVLFFKPLTRPVLREIAYRRVQEVLQREGIARRDVDVEVDEGVIDWVVEHGYSERYGARYLSRQIEKTITYPLAQQLIRNDPPPGSLLRLFIHNERIASALVLPVKAAAEEPAAANLLIDTKKLPKRLTADHLRTGLPLLRERVKSLEEAHDLHAAREQLTDLLQAMSTASFWDDPDTIQPKLATVGHLSSQVELVDGLRRNLEELADYVGEIEADSPEALSEAVLRYRYLVRELPRAELTMLIDEPWDTLSAYICIEARGRKTASGKWVAELAEMYTAWAAKREFTVNIISEEMMKSGNLQSVLIAITGYGVYGLLRGEAGTHQLIQTAKNGAAEIVEAKVELQPVLPQSEMPPLERSHLNVQTHVIDEPGALSERLIAHVVVAQKDHQDGVSLWSSLAVDRAVEEAVTLLRIRDALRNHQGWNGSKPMTEPVRAYVRHKKSYVEDFGSKLKSGKLAATLHGALDPFLEARLRSRTGSLTTDITTIQEGKNVGE